jgi:hypothetical protein
LDGVVKEVKLLVVDIKDKKLELVTVLVRRCATLLRRYQNYVVTE